MATGKKTTRINGGTKTVAAVFDGFNQQWTPDWDKPESEMQGVDRAKARAKMGQKMTPIGAGKLLKKR